MALLIYSVIFFLRFTHALIYHQVTADLAPSKQHSLKNAHMHTLTGLLESGN